MYERVKEGRNASEGSVRDRGYREALPFLTLFVGTVVSACILRVASRATCRVLRVVCYVSFLG